MTLTVGNKTCGPKAEPNVAQPLPLHGSHNTRDLGGYPTAHGGVTQTHCFLRSDAIERWDAHDVAAMQAYGLSTIVDLRSRYEREKAPDPVVDGVRAVHAPMLDNMHSSGFAQGVPNAMSELYISLLAHDGQTLCQVMRALLAPGCALFHCTAGKDRTGVVSMLLLKLADVPDDVVARLRGDRTVYGRPVCRAARAVAGVGIHGAGERIRFAAR